MVGYVPCWMVLHEFIMNPMNSSWIPKGSRGSQCGLALPNLTPSFWFGSLTWSWAGRFWEPSMETIWNTSFLGGTHSHSDGGMQHCICYKPWCSIVTTNTARRYWNEEVSLGHCFRGTATFATSNMARPTTGMTLFEQLKEIMLVNDVHTWV